MNFKRIALAFLGLLLALAIVLPLRVLRERSYESQQHSALLGEMTATVDGQYYPMPCGFWFDGSQMDAPYRLRLFYKPSDQREHVFSITRLSIDSLEVPVAPGVVSPQRGSDQALVYIAGYMNVPLHSSESNVRVEYTLDGQVGNLDLRLVIQCKTRIVHAWLESIMGI